jgi:hypothetical protein
LFAVGRERVASMPIRRAKRIDPRPKARVFFWRFLVVVVTGVVFGCL